MSKSPIATIPNASIRTLTGSLVFIFGCVKTEISARKNPSTNIASAPVANKMAVKNDPQFLGWIAGVEKFIFPRLLL